MGLCFSCDHKKDHGAKNGDRQDVEQEDRMTGWRIDPADPAARVGSRRRIAPGVHGTSEEDNKVWSAPLMRNSVQGAMDRSQHQVWESARKNRVNRRGTYSDGDIEPGMEEMQIERLLGIRDYYYKAPPWEPLYE